MERVNILHSLAKTLVTCTFSRVLARDCIRFGTSPGRFSASQCTAQSSPLPFLPRDTWIFFPGKSPVQTALSLYPRAGTTPPRPTLSLGSPGFFESSAEALDSLALVSPCDPGRCCNISDWLSLAWSRCTSGLLLPQGATFLPGSRMGKLRLGGRSKNHQLDDWRCPGWGLRNFTHVLESLSGLEEGG